MKIKLIVPAVIALSALALPAMAQDYYGRFDGTIPLTGAQMSDFPSSRANVTLSGSFLRPNGPDLYAYNAPVRHHRHYRPYNERYDDYRYDGR